ncbi:MAG: RNA polymerase sigma factor [Deltaproteobacteria bacterium]
MLRSVTARIAVSPDGVAMSPPAELMGRYQNGDVESFRELYALVAPRLLGYLVKLTRNRALADDVLQLTFLKVHRARATYIRGANPVPWIHTIAHRTFIDEVRRNRSAIVAVAGAHLPEIAADVTGTAADRGDEIGGDPELVCKAVDALAALPAHQREAIVLTKLEGKSVVEAAQIARTTSCALRVRAHRGYVALRSALGAGLRREANPMAWR